MGKVRQPQPHHCYHCTLLRLFSLPVIVVRLFLCLICKLNFIIGVYVWEKTYYTLGIIHGLGHPLGGPGKHPLWMGDDCPRPLYLRGLSIRGVWCLSGVPEPPHTHTDGEHTAQGESGITAARTRCCLLPRGRRNEAVWRVSWTSG